MLQRAAGKNTLAAITLFLCLFAQWNTMGAQSLSTLRIGDPSSRLSTLGQAMASDSYKGMDVRKWVLPNGNELSATTSSTGRIVYLESDSGSKNDDPACDIPGLHFGLTTLSELRKRFRSNGFGFKDRPSVIETADGVVMVNAYEVGTVVVTFFTKISLQDHSQMQASGANSSAADYAKLDAISIADAGYAKSEWGDLVYDPQYKSAEWK